MVRKRTCTRGGGLLESLEKIWGADRNLVGVFRNESFKTHHSFSHCFFFEFCGVQYGTNGVSYGISVGIYGTPWGTVLQERQVV